VESVDVTVESSVFSTVLGATETLDLAFDEPYWLGI